jgi:hypothetical protein
VVREERGGWTGGVVLDVHGIVGEEGRCMYLCLGTVIIASADLVLFARHGGAWRDVMSKVRVLVWVIVGRELWRGCLGR